MLKPIFIVVLATAITAACDRDRRQAVPTVGNEAPTPVERPDAPVNSDWCKQHGVPESRCAPCLARKDGGSESLGAGICGIATTTCEDTAAPATSPSTPKLSATKPRDALSDGTMESVR